MLYIIIWLTDIANYNFLTCAKAEIKDLTFFIVVNGEKFDLDLDRTMAYVELFRAIFIYYNMFKFQVDWTIIFWVIVYTDTQTDRQTDMSTL